jgi:hypothetical protein
MPFGCCVSLNKTQGRARWWSTKVDPCCNYYRQPALGYRARTVSLLQGDFVPTLTKLVTNGETVEQYSPDVSFRSALE